MSEIEKVVKFLENPDEHSTEEWLRVLAIAQRLQAVLPVVVAEFQHTQDLLFGLLDYFEPGSELVAINAQRERNREALRALQGEQE